MNRLIIVGSPRLEGRSTRLANQLFEACIEECPDDELALVPVSEVNVAGCTGCGACSRIAAGESLEEVLADVEKADFVADAAAGLGGDAAVGTPKVASEDDDASALADQPQKAPVQKSKQAAQFDHPRRCAIDDDMGDIYELIDEAEELTVVSPVYFAGPPSQLKALLDRLQPYFARTAAERAAAAAEGRPYKTAIKPAVLHVVGEGSDPHGFAALVTIVQSALAVAGYRLETVLNWVGKIAPDGEILEEAEVIDLFEDDEDVYADVSVVFGPDDDGDADMVSGFAPDDDEDAEGDYFVLADGCYGRDNDLDGRDGRDDYRDSRDGDCDGRDDYDDDADDYGNYDREGDYDRDDYYDEEDYDIESEPVRPRLRLNDTQVEERGRASAEAGRSGGKKGKTDKRSSKGGTQTNNRNPRKENQAKARKRHTDNASGSKSGGMRKSNARSNGSAGGGRGAGSRSADGRNFGSRSGSNRSVDSRGASSRGGSNRGTNQGKARPANGAGKGKGRAGKSGSSAGRAGGRR